MDPASLALSLFLIAPCRYVDTREMTCVPGSQPDLSKPCPVGPLTSEETRLYLIQANPVCPDVPLGAKALQVTVTVTEATAPGNLLLYDATLYPRPLASSINFQPGRTVANTVTVALGQWQGQEIGIPIYPDLAVYASSAGTEHFILDIVGYYMEGQP